MASTKMRVPIPSNPQDLLNLATDISTKNTADGATSPLNSMKDYSWAVEAPKLVQAQAKHDEAEEYKKKMETAYKERDLIMTNVKGIIRASRDILMGINSNNMKRLTEWGFSVESTPASSRAKKSAAAKQS